MRALANFPNMPLDESGVYGVSRAFFRRSGIFRWHTETIIRLEDPWEYIY